jgi:hypothetical protein
MDVFLPPSTVKDNAPSALAGTAHIVINVSWPDLQPGDNARTAAIDALQKGIIGILPTVYEQIEMRITNA